MIHPRTLPFDRISQTTYSLFHNNVFQRMSTDRTPSTGTTTSEHPTNFDHHHQNTIGDHFSIQKSNSTFRLLGQNINGISHSHNFNKWHEILQSTVLHEMDCLCFAETNLEWRHPLVAHKIPTITKRFFHHSRMISTSSTIKFERIYKPGGTASLITNEWTGRIITSETDSSGLGRWTTFTLNGKRHRKIAIITAYQVCKTSIHQCGFTTCFSQQWHLLRSQGNEFPDPRKQFWNDLTRHIKILQSSGHLIILIGDFNTHNDNTTNNPLQALQSSCQLSDAISHFHDCSGQTSYSRGATIIDYCFLSTELLPCIRACGYLPLHFFSYSDHRSLYVDFNSVALFGGSPPKIPKPTARFVNSRDPQSTAKFLQRLQTYWAEHSLSQRVTRLANTLQRTTTVSTPARNLAQKIDRDRTRGFLKSEKKCHRPIRPPWSRPLHRLSRQFRYWQIFISDIKLRRHSYNALITIEDEIEWRPSFYPTTLTEAKQLLNDTKQKLRELRKTAESHRSQDLQLQAQEADLAGDHNKATILRRLHRAETTHKAFLKLRRFLKSKNTGGVTKLEIPINQPDGSVNVELSEDPKLIETACLDRNRNHFAQAQGTPFTIPPLSMIESSACGPVSDCILEGRLEDLPFDTKTLPEAQRIILEELEQCCPTMNDSIEFNDFKRRFSVWREATSTSPSGMYLSLYKALITGSIHDGILDDALLKAGEDIFMDIFTLSNLACRHGFAFARWKEVVNCMINKKVDSFSPNQLRVIHLFEADYNLVIGLIFGRYMIHRICDHGMFHPSQWGRPNRECEDVLMIKELTYQVAAMSRTDLATFDNDASACYDRIVTRFALLCCRAHGVPEGPCKMTAEVLDNVIHKIKTAYGISEEYYNNTPDTPIHGVGQGSQDGPSLWGVSSSVTFRAADRLSVGLTCVNPCFDLPNRSITHSRKQDGFVDDVTGWFNRMLQELRSRYPNFNFSTQPVSELARGMQNDASTWQTVLEISGGKLAVAKCLYYLAHWRWTNDGIPELTPAASIGNPIKLNDESGPIEIPHFDTQEAHLTLGVWKSPSGNLDKQFTHLLSKSRKWTKAMQSAPLTKDEAYLSYSRIYIPSLRYGLGTCYFDPTALLKIQRPAVNTILPKMGFNRHLPRAVVYGPRNLGALGLPSLIFEQGLQQVQFLGRHLRSPNSPLRSLFQLGVEWFRTLCGYTTCPLASPAINTQHVELATWFRSLQGFLATIHHSLEIPNLYLPRSVRQSDVAIMDLPTATFTLSDLQRINRCRLYLQVSVLSEISTGDGTQLQKEAWKGQLPLNNYSLLLWPRQPRPSAPAWRTWRRFLTQALRPGHYTCYSTHLPLKQPLGDWFSDFQRDRHWQWFYSPRSTTFLRYDRMAKSYQGHPAHTNQHRITADIDPAFCRYDLPDDAVPCDPRIRDDVVSISARTAFTPPSTPPQPVIHQFCPYTDDILPHPNQPPSVPVSLTPTNWSTCYQQLPAWEAALLPDTLDSSVIKFITLAHQQRANIFHCSDGSSLGDLGSFGWTFGPNTTIILKHSGPAFGLPMDSYLAEGYGLLSSSCFWYRLIKFVLHCRRPRFKIRMYCDNKSLVRRVNEFLYMDGSFRRSLAPNYDVVFLTACVIAQFPPETIQVQHVKGHQDAFAPLHQLSWPAQLNVVADREAAQFLSTLDHSLPTPFLPSAQIHLRDPQHNTIIKKWNIHLRTIFYQRQYHAWLCKQFSWPSSILEDVDFEGLDLAIRCLPTHLHRFVVKWINQSLPTRRRVHRYDRHIPPTCQVCPTIIECDHHLLQCPSVPRRAACGDAYIRLEERLTTLHTHPGIQRTVLHLVALAMDIPTCAPSPSQLPAYPAQNIIGSIQFLKGRWSRTFRRTQEQFYRAQQRPPSFTGDRWMKQMLCLIFEQLHNIWRCRNTQTHGADQQLQEQLKKGQLTIRVHALYNQRSQLLAHDRDILDTVSPDELLSGPIATIETWLKMAEPTIQRCLKDARTKLTTNQRDIRDYFDDASYIDSDADDISLSCDSTLDSGTIIFSSSSHSTSSSDSSGCNYSSPSGTHYSGSDGST